MGYSKDACLQYKGKYYLPGTILEVNSEMFERLGMKYFQLADEDIEPSIAKKRGERGYCWHKTYTSVISPSAYKLDIIQDVPPPDNPNKNYKKSIWANYDGNKEMVHKYVTLGTKFVYLEFIKKILYGEDKGIYFYVRKHDSFNPNSDIVYCERTSPMQYYGYLCRNSSRNREEEYRADDTCFPFPKTSKVPIGLVLNEDYISLWKDSRGEFLRITNEYSGSKSTIPIRKTINIRHKDDLDNLFIRVVEGRERGESKPITYTRSRTKESDLEYQGKDVPQVVGGWIIYVFLMLVSTIFNGRLGMWAMWTVIWIFLRKYFILKWNGEIK